MATKKVQVMQCDNPECRAEAITSKEEPAFGFYIQRGFWATGSGGGPLRNIYACSVECITPAIEEMR